jgi:hypothetical protein
MAEARERAKRMKRIGIGFVAALAVALSVLSASAQNAPPNGLEATSTPLLRPHGLAYDTAGNYYIADTDQNVIREVSPAGIITTVGGDGEQGYAGDGGPATAAILDSPSGVAVDSNGNIYIADTHNNVIREVVATSGDIATIAGTGVAGYSGDGLTATAATLNYPTAVAVDSNGNVYIADTNNHRIREITGTTINTVAGDGEQFYSGDGGLATAAGLDSPNGVAVDSALNIYIGDTHNQRVRMVAAGIITTLAGTGVEGYNGDGTATAVELARPRGVAVDASGNVYLADSDNNLIRSISGGNVTTIAGTSLEGYSGDGGAALSAWLDTPDAVAISGATILFSDTENDRVRVVSAGAIDSIAGSSSGQTESLVITGATPQVYGAGTLIATFSNGGNIGTGLVTFYDGEGASPAVVGSQSLSGNIASLGTSLLSLGTHYIVASYAGDANNAPIVSGVFVLTVTPGPFTGFNFSYPFEGAPQAFTGWPIYVTVTAVDQYGNTVTTFPDTVHVTSSDPAAVLPPDSTLFNGTGTFEATLNTPGSQTFTVTDTANSIASTTSPIFVLATPNLVVTMAADDAVPGDGTKCTPQATPGIGTDAACGLRDALNYSSSFGGANITFDSTKVPARTTITLTSGSLDIPNDTSITSTGTRTVSGGNLSGVFTMQDQNAQGIVNGLTITGGNLSNSTPGAQLTGAAIDNDGTLTVENCTISGNSASASDPTGVVYGGAIYTDSDLEISNSVVSGNSATAGGFAVGGGIYNSSYMNATNVTVSGNTVSVPTSEGFTLGGGIFTGDMDMLNSTVSGNTATGPADGTGAAYGGGILAVGNTNIEYSTITGNTARAAGGGAGGGIYALNNQHEKNTTISNNTADGDAGGYYLGATARLANTILAGNHALTNTDFDNQGSLTDQGGNLVSITGINLSPLGNYGGSTQTMLPLPGSPAICAGLVARIPSGVTTDQRGDPNTNSTYLNTGGTCVDAGAVQTNYSIEFTTPPPAEAAINLPFTPAPVIGLLESGVPLSLNSGTVVMSDSSGQLAGILSENLNAGSAVFNDLTVPSLLSGDTLTATLPLNSPVITTVQAATTTNIVEPTPATLTGPAPNVGTQLGANPTFAWSGGVGVRAYQLRLGTTGVGSSDLFNSGNSGNLPATATGVTVTTPSLPSNGDIVYARLYSYINGAWLYSDYTYLESGTAAPATLTGPAPNVGTQLGANPTFAWSGGVGVRYYELYLGSTGVGSSNLFYSGDLPSTASGVTVTGPGLPSNGVTVYARLYSYINGAWQHNDYTYVESGTPMAATLSSPTPNVGTALGTNPTFAWTGGIGVMYYELYLGTTEVGSYDLFISGNLPATATGVTVTGPGLPSNGVTVYARLYSWINGAWQHYDYTYVESGTPQPR